MPHQMGVTGAFPVHYGKGNADPENQDGQLPPVVSKKNRKHKRTKARRGFFHPEGDAFPIISKSSIL